jgi:hypothetical protein
MSVGKYGYMNVFNTFMSIFYAGTGRQRYEFAKYLVRMRRIERHASAHMAGNFRHQFLNAGLEVCGDGSPRKYPTVLCWDFDGDAEGGGWPGEIKEWADGRGGSTIHGHIYSICVF